MHQPWRRARLLSSAYPNKPASRPPRWNGAVGDLNTGRLRTLEAEATPRWHRRTVVSRADRKPKPGFATCSQVPERFPGFTHATREIARRWRLGGRSAVTPHRIRSLRRSRRRDGLQLFFEMAVASKWRLQVISNERPLDSPHRPVSSSRICSTCQDCLRCLSSSGRDFTHDGTPLFPPRRSGVRMAAWTLVKANLT